MRLPLRAFALAAIVLMLAPLSTPVLATALADDAQARARRATEATLLFEREGPTPEALAALKAVIAEQPEDVRSSPMMRELEARVETLSDPLLALYLAPYMEEGGMAEILASPTHGRMWQNVTAGLQRELGMVDGASSLRFAPEADELAGVDLDDPEAFAAAIAALPDEAVADLVMRLSASVHAWNATAGSRLARDLDGLAQELARESPAAFKADMLADPALAESYRAAVAGFRAALERNAPPEVALFADEQAIVDAFRADLVARMARESDALGLADDPFLGLPGLDDAAYEDGAGPVAIDGEPLVDLDALLAPELPALAPGVHEMAPVLDAPTAAARLGLRGSPGASSVSVGDEAEFAAEEPAEGALVSPFDGEVHGVVGPWDEADNFTFHVPLDHFVELHLDTAGGNADLAVWCQDNLRFWSSRSTPGFSKLPEYDSVTFTHNSVGRLGESAFAPAPWLDEPEAATCPSGNFTVSVRYGFGPGQNATWALSGDLSFYNGDPCPDFEPSFEAALEGEVDACGMNHVRWGDRCHSDDIKCLFTRPPAGEGLGEVILEREEGNPLAFGPFDQSRNNPVVFVHGVGGGYHAWTHPHDEAQNKFLNLEGIEDVKQLASVILASAWAVGAAVVMIALYIQVRQFMASPSVVTALWTLYQLVDGLATIADTWSDLSKLNESVWGTWRAGDTEDLEGHFWNVRDAGFDTYWVEYNVGDNNARLGQARSAAPQLGAAIDAIQQEFYQRHQMQPGAPRAPEDVEVDIVAHSMGGIVSRIYTVDPAIYEADVNKLIQIQTPNMGSTPAYWVRTMAARASTDLFLDLMLDITVLLFDLVIGKYTKPFRVFGSTFNWGGDGKLSKWDKYGFGQKILLWGFKYAAGVLLRSHFELDLRKDITRSPGIEMYFTSVGWMNRQTPAPDVDHGMMFGDPFDGSFAGLGDFDLLVSEKDVKGPPSLVAVSAVARIHNDHLSALFAQTPRDLILQWLSNPDGGALPSPPEEAGALMTLADADTGHSLRRDFGHDVPRAEAQPGARYVPDAGAAAQRASLPRLETPLGDITAKTHRLAVQKALPGASAYAGLGVAAQTSVEAVNGSASQEERDAAINGSVASFQGVFAGPLSRPGDARRTNDLAPDVGVIAAGHDDGAQSLLARLGEPSARLQPTAFGLEWAKRRVVLAPTGSLAGSASHAALRSTMDEYVREGGVLVVLAQRSGADLASVPGAPRGFGFAEETSAYTGGVVLGAFTPALASQDDVYPDIHADGSLASLPEGADVLLRSTKSGRPVAATWTWGEGRVVVAQIAPDWADLAAQGTTDERLFLRDLLAWVRAEDAPAHGAPGAETTIEVDVAAPEGASAINLILVDAGARDAASVTLPAEACCAWTFTPEAAGPFSIDAVILDAEGNATERRLDVARGYVSTLAGGPGGVRPALSPILLDVTAPSARVEEGGTFRADLRVTSAADAPSNVTLGWFYPAHGVGAAPARNGSAAAWDDQFQLRDVVEVAPGATATLSVELSGALRADEIAARAYGDDGSVLAEARLGFTTYRSSVVVDLASDRAAYAAGDEATLAVSARDATAPADAEYPATVVATLRAPDGVALATRETIVSIAGAPATHEVTFTLPEGASGTLRADVEVRRAGERIGGASLPLRIPGAQLATRVELPARFDAGEAAPVTLRLSDPGVEDALDGAVTVTLLGPDGAPQWSETRAVPVSAGGEAVETFLVTPTSATLGEYTLTVDATTHGDTFPARVPIRAGVQASISFDRASYRARDDIAATARLLNDGRFALDLDAALASELGFAPAQLATPLAPGERATLVLAGAIPADVASGTHNLTLTLAAGGASRALARGFSVPPASVTLVAGTPPTGAGERAELTLANRGGVDAPVAWSATLADAQGIVVASASGAPIVLAGESAEIGLDIPAQAASGSYHLSVAARPPGARPIRADSALEIAGVAGEIELLAASTAEVGATVALDADATSTGAPLEGATIEYQLVRPKPLPAWIGLAELGAATSFVEYGGARWVGTNAGLVRVAADGALTTFTAELPSPRVTALAVARGALHVGTDAGLARFDGVAWTQTTTLPLPQSAVRALAGNDDALYVAATSGLARIDDAGIAALALPEDAALSLAGDERELWAALADLREGFTGESRTFPRDGTLRPLPTVAIGPAGDVVVAYADNTSEERRIELRRFAATGEALGEPVVVATGAAARQAPSVVVDGTGRAHVAWEDHRDGSADIYLRSVSPAGALGPEVRVTDAPTHEKTPELLLSAGNELVLTWLDTRVANPPGSPARNDELFTARYALDGSVILPVTQLTDTPRYVLRHDADLDEAGNLHVAYTDGFEWCDPEFPEICFWNLESFYARYSPTGEALVPPLVASDADDELSWLPAIAVRPDGNAHLVYQEVASGIQLAHTHVTAAGQLSVVGELLTSAGGARWPQALARDDGRIDVLWTDARSGRYEAWHNVLDPDQGAFVGSDVRVHAALAEGSVGTHVRLARTDAGTLAAVWEETSAAAPAVGLAIAPAGLEPRGAAKLDLAGGAWSRLAAPGARVVALSAREAAIASPTEITFLRRDGSDATSLAWTGAAPPTALALSHGRAYLAAADGVREADPLTGAVRVVDAGGPAAPRSLAANAQGVLVAGEGLALLRADREDATAPIVVPWDAPAASIAAPDEPGRVLLRARLVSATGQRLAEDVEPLFVREGTLALMLAPTPEPATPGEPVELALTALNRGDVDLGEVVVRIDAGGDRVLDARAPLAAGEARTWRVSVARSLSYDVLASAEGAPVDALGLAASESASITDHVRVEAPALLARILAPDVAGAEPIAVDVLLANGGIRPLTLRAAIGDDARSVVVPARSRVVLDDLHTLAVLEDTTLRLRVDGDALAGASHLVRAGARATLAGATGLAGAPGERTVSLALQNEGEAPSAFTLTLALDGAPIPSRAMELAPGALAHEDVTLPLAAGVHELLVTTPWETRALRLVASDGPLALLALAPLVEEGDALVANVTVENAGPGALEGALALALATESREEPLALAEGESRSVAWRIPLAALVAGEAELTAEVIVAGAPVASEALALAVPGPRVAFASEPAPRSVAPGETLALSYQIQHVGGAAGDATVRVRVGGSEEMTRVVSLAPGALADASFAAKLDEDLPAGALVVEAQAPGAQSAVSLDVAGARVDASAAPSRARFAAGEMGALRVSVANPGARPLDLVARAQLGLERANVSLTLAPGATEVVDLPLRVMAEDDAGWSVELASGRVLAQGATWIALDSFEERGVEASLDVQDVAAGGFVNVTVRTALEGRVDVLGPGFRDAFTLNGTTTRTYLVPANVTAGRYNVFWNFDAASATGVLPLGVRGLEITTTALAVSAEDAPAASLAPGDAATIKWTLRASAATQATLNTWFEDVNGRAWGAGAAVAVLAPGEQTLVVERGVPAGMPPGPARFAAALVDARGETLASGDHRFQVRGFALRELAAAEEDGALVVRIAATGDGEADVRLDARMGAPVGGRMPLDGATRSFVVPVPEPGEYAIDVAIDAGEHLVRRTLRGALAGAGTPPVSTYEARGTTLWRGDVLLATADATFAFSATDEGAGVASIDVIGEEGRIDASAPISLPDGLHALSYAARDRAANQEAWRALTVHVDGAPPVLSPELPRTRTVQVNGEERATLPVASLALPAIALPPELDTDGDGHADLEEIVEGSAPDDAASTPARYTPAPPPKPAPFVTAVGSLRVNGTARDDGVGLASVRALLDGREVASTDAGSYDWNLSLLDEAPGEHLLTLVATDALGQKTESIVRVLVIAAGEAALAEPETARAFAAWIAGEASGAPGVVADDLARREARAAAIEAQLQREVIGPSTPPAVGALPGHVEKEIGRVEDALEECGCVP